MPTSVAPGQYDAPDCWFCGRPIDLLRDGRAWINGMRTCMPCATGGEDGEIARRRHRKLRGAELSVVG